MLDFIRAKYSHYGSGEVGIEDQLYLLDLLCPQLMLPLESKKEWNVSCVLRGQTVLQNQNYKFPRNSTNLIYCMAKNPSNDIQYYFKCQIIVTVDPTINICWYSMAMPVKKRICFFKSSLSTLKDIMCLWVVATIWCLTEFVELIICTPHESTV